MCKNRWAYDVCQIFVILWKMHILAKLFRIFVVFKPINIVNTSKWRSVSSIFKRLRKYEIFVLKMQFTSYLYENELWHLFPIRITELKSFKKLLREVFLILIKPKYLWRISKSRILVILFIAMPFLRIFGLFWFSCKYWNVCDKENM